MIGIKPGPHRAGIAHYRGRIDDMTGKAFGPTTYGSWVIAVSQEYDNEADRTTVTFNHAEPVQS